jgi:hypothetical protein
MRVPIAGMLTDNAAIESPMLGLYVVRVGGGSISLLSLEEVAAMGDALTDFANARGVKRLTAGGISIHTDPTLPANEIQVLQGGKLIARVKRVRQER